MNTKVRSYLIEKARKKQTCYYQELSDTCKLGLLMSESPHDRAEIGKVLGEISAYEHDHERPLLSALVISKGDNYQGDGFYKLAEELGYGKWQTLKKDISFEIGQMNQCFDFWGDDEQYRLNK
tara:strand:+ start:1139 stop:1507 length:369 start_codon:yes stop_codon:yes gene_type:complete